MANITMVKIYDHKDGKQMIFVYYRSKYRFRNDNIRCYASLPNTANKFIEAAKYIEAKEYPDFTLTKYYA